MGSRRFFDTAKHTNTYTAKQRTHFAQLRGESCAGVGVVGVLVVRLDVDLPGGVRMEALIGGVTPPKTLDQHCRCRYLAVKVLLALLLLDFEREA